MLPAAESYWLVRLLFQRALAIIYLSAFLVAWMQFRPLAGEDGLLPIENYVERGSFRERPSLFFYYPSDRVVGLAAGTGVVLSALAVLGVPYLLPEPYPIVGAALLWGLLWALYLSFVNAGQLFYGYGWESMLLETGFLAIFLGAGDTGPPVLVIWLLKWVLFRNMFGAGLIKIRGDDCWRELTCLDYHYEVACAGRLKNRFMPDKSDQRYAKLQDLIRGAKARYGREATLTMFSMTGSTTFPNGRPRPVLDHAEDLDQSWKSVRRGIHQVHEYGYNPDRSAKKHDFVYLAVPEPHESGHLHWHVVIISDEDFTETDFQTLADRHVRNCPIAGPEAHKVVDDPEEEDDSCIECRDLSDIDNAAAYIAKYLGTYGEDPRDLPDHWQVFQTILWATDKRRWRPSQQAQTFMATADNPDPSEWEIVGVYDDGLWGGSVNRVDPEKVNRSYKMETGNKQSAPNTPYWQAEPPP